VRVRGWSEGSGLVGQIGMGARWELAVNVRE
jgi:hypothetical protein